MSWTSQVYVAQEVIIEGPGDFLLVYNGSAALGNLIASVAPQPGTDGFGNAYLNGVVSYDTTNHIACSNRGGEVNYWTAPGPAGPWASQLSLALDTSGNYDMFAASGAEALLGNGLLRLKNAINVASDPANPASAETWHALSYFNGWGPRAGFFPRYKMLPDGRVAFTGCSLAPGTTANGTKVASLAVGYFPAKPKVLNGYCDVLGTQAPRFAVDTAGNITCAGIGAASTLAGWDECSMGVDI